eukprot:CAMPEP_0184696184 /NCGR_PEP_ID=MMETSP0313-20130426/3559_1 /TAXON_ID=2792 /ORGANISM="Porphyridium aerugineum, Strain SAG 1380-2" /LENGTH=763 /DNA_ID=CAMNT_0027154759 /DNA_START=85 /DNA_END=2376 /DNA_ORIENTATION=-
MNTDVGVLGETTQKEMRSDSENKTAAGMAPVLKQCIHVQDLLQEWTVRRAETNDGPTASVSTVFQAIQAAQMLIQRNLITQRLCLSGKCASAYSAGNPVSTDVAQGATHDKCQISYLDCFFCKSMPSHPRALHMNPSNLYLCTQCFFVSCNSLDVRTRAPCKGDSESKNKPVYTHLEEHTCQSGHTFWYSIDLDILYCSICACHIIDPNVEQFIQEAHHTIKDVRTTHTVPVMNPMAWATQSNISIVSLQPSSIIAKSKADASPLQLRDDRQAKRARTLADMPTTVCQTASYIPSDFEKRLIKTYGVVDFSEKSALLGGEYLPGLFNLGNTCYMNAVLQALLYVPPFRNFFLTGSHAVSCKKAESLCLMCTLGKLVCDVYTGAAGSKGFLIPQSIMEQVWNNAENLASYEQHDAHELMLTLLNILLNQNVSGLVKDPDSSPINPGSARPQPIPSFPVDKTAGDDAHDAHALIHKFFSGTIQSNVVCRKCQNMSPTMENFFDISLDIEKGKHALGGSNGSNGVSKIDTTNSHGSADHSSESETNGAHGGSAQPDSINQEDLATPACSLLDSLVKFTTPEILDGGQTYCSKCQSKQEAIKQLSFYRLPQILCIHLKRFEHGGATSQKLETLVEFPTSSLDMSPFLSSTIFKDKAMISLDASGQAVAAETEDVLANLRIEKRDSDGVDELLTVRNELGRIYDLFAVVNHLGKIDRGHYISWVRLRDEWYVCDDEKVFKTKSINATIRSREAYLLFYVSREVTGILG